MAERLRRLTHNRTLQIFIESLINRLFLGEVLGLFLVHWLYIVTFFPRPRFRVPYQSMRYESFSEGEYTWDVRWE